MINKPFRACLKQRALRILVPSKKTTPIIIGGWYRSGTSLLRRILDSHSNIHCPPEIKFFKDFFGDYMNDELKGLRFFSTARSMGLETRDILSIFGSAFIFAHEKAARAKNKRRWADKNPENLLYLKDWHELLDEKMLFVFMVRNPLDALSSLIEIKFEKAVPARLEDKIDLYCKFMSCGLNFVELYPEKSIIIKYEDLVSDARGTIMRLCNFLGEDFELDLLTEFSSPARQTGIEDPKILLRKEINPSSVDRWKSDLTEEQVELIHVKCNHIAASIGYANDQCH